MLPLNGNSTSQRYVGHAKSRQTLKLVAVPLQLRVASRRDGRRTIGNGHSRPPDVAESHLRAQEQAMLMQALYAEQLRGRLRSPERGRASTSSRTVVLIARQPSRSRPLSQ